MVGWSTEPFPQAGGVVSWNVEALLRIGGGVFGFVPPLPQPNDPVFSRAAPFSAAREAVSGSRQAVAATDAVLERLSKE